MNSFEEYRALLDRYADGMYTYAEVVSMSLELLFLSDDRDAFWLTLTPDHRERMTRLLTNFDESAEPFAINTDPNNAWREMSDLKRWLAAR